MQKERNPFNNRHELPTESQWRAVQRDLKGFCKIYHPEYEDDEFTGYDYDDEDDEEL